MEFYEAVNRRRSIRQFEDKEIPREILERILDAGLKAPSSNHQRRWELVTLTEKAVIMELAKFVRPHPCRIQEAKTPQQEMFKIAYPRQRSMIEESACVILPYFKQKYTFDNDKNGYGLMDHGVSCMEKVHVVNGKTVDVNMGAETACVYIAGKKYELKGDTLAEPEG